MAEPIYAAVKGGQLRSEHRTSFVGSRPGRPPHPVPPGPGQASAPSAARAQTDGLAARRLIMPLASGGYRRSATPGSQPNPLRPQRPNRPGAILGLQ